MDALPLGGGHLSSWLTSFLRYRHEMSAVYHTGAVLTREISQIGTDL